MDNIYEKSNITSLRLQNDIKDLNELRLEYREFFIKISDLYNFMYEERFVIFLKFFPINPNKVNEFHNEKCLLDFLILFDYKYPFNYPSVFQKKVDVSKFCNQNSMDIEIHNFNYYNLNSISNNYGLVELGFLNELKWGEINNLNSIIYQLYIHIKTHFEEFQFSNSESLNMTQSNKNSELVELDSEKTQQEINKFEATIKNYEFVNRISQCFEFLNFKTYSNNNKSKEIIEIKNLNNFKLINLNLYSFNNGFKYNQFNFQSMLPVIGNSEFIETKYAFKKIDKDKLNAFSYQKINKKTSLNIFENREEDEEDFLFNKTTNDLNNLELSSFKIKNTKSILGANSCNNKSLKYLLNNLDLINNNKKNEDKKIKLEAK